MILGDAYGVALVAAGACRVAHCHTPAICCIVRHSLRNLTIGAPLIVDR